MTQWVLELAQESDDGEGGVSIDVPAAGAVRCFGPGAFPTLLTMLGTRENSMGRSIGRYLDQEGFTRFRPTPAASIRRAGWVAFWALEDQAGPEVPKIIGLLSDPDPEVRNAALDALYFVGYRDGGVASVQSVIEALRDSSPRVRASAAATLAGLNRRLKNSLGANRDTGCRAAVPILLSLFHDPDRQVRASAESALLEIDPATAARQGLK